MRLTVENRDNLIDQFPQFFGTKLGFQKEKNGPGFPGLDGVRIRKV